MLQLNYVILSADEHHMVFVYSTKAHAKILAVDYSKALEMPGVKDYISHKDVPGPNIWGVDVADEEVFASSKVCNIFQFSFSQFLYR